MAEEVLGAKPAGRIHWTNSENEKLHQLKSGTLVPAKRINSSLVFDESLNKSKELKKFIFCMKMAFF